MKLRLRSFESKETLKIEVPNSCTLPQLRRILSENLPNSPSPASIRLSLNRKDELQSDGESTLQFLGVSAGDLIYYSVEQTADVMSANSESTPSLVTDSTSTPGFENSECSTLLNTENTIGNVQDSDSVILDAEKVEALDTGSQMDETVDYMEADVEGNENSYNSDESLGKVVDKSFSVPGFLRKVFMEELGDDGGRHHKLIVIAVHAVMLESGFVPFDEKANVVVNGFQFRDNWPLNLFGLSLIYTLPYSLCGDSGVAIKSVVLKFQSLGKYIYVYGGLRSGKRGTHRVQINEELLVPLLNVVWANCGLKGYIINGKDGEVLVTEKVVFEFWRSVKDNLSLPLLIDLCEEAGLELPPCFIRLPTDLKLKILEYLPGADVAKVSCVCSELLYLASNDDLWKLKFAEEFGDWRKEAQRSWKNAFVAGWNCKRVASRVRSASYWTGLPNPPRRRRYHRYPNPLVDTRVPRIIGGDYDILPAPSGDNLHGMLQDPVNHPMRSFSPRCNLGVRGGRFI